MKGCLNVSTIQQRLEHALERGHGIPSKRFRPIFQRNVKKRKDSEKFATRNGASHYNLAGGPRSSFHEKRWSHFHLFFFLRNRLCELVVHHTRGGRRYVLRRHKFQKNMTEQKTYLQSFEIERMHSSSVLSEGVVVRRLSRSRLFWTLLLCRTI